MGTRKGVIKKSLLADYSRPRQNGVNAITIKENDELIQARLTNGRNEILMATSSGRAIRFNESTVRCVGRTSQGVKGITLESDKVDVVGMICVKNLEEDILVVSEKGFGKRSKIEDYRITNRGGKGVKTMRITDKTGDLITIKNVTDENDLMIINKSGITIRLSVANVRTTGRATQGVRFINLDKKQDEIASIAKVLAETIEDEIELMDQTDDIIETDETNQSENFDTQVDE
jgi:DNA gyrase subunit A